MGPRFKNRGPSPAPRAFFLPISLEISEAPAVAHPADPQQDGALVQIATFEKLFDRETVWNLATFAVVLPPSHHLARDPPAAFGNNLPIDIVSEQPANDIELQSISLSRHLLSLLSWLSGKV